MQGRCDQDLIGAGCMKCLHIVQPTNAAASRDFQVRVFTPEP